MNWPNTFEKPLGIASSAAAERPICDREYKREVGDWSGDGMQSDVVVAFRVNLFISGARK